MTNPTPHGQVPEALIDLIDAYAETRHRCGGIYNAKTEAARKAVIEALSGVQALSAAPAGWKLVPVEPTNEMQKAADEWAAKGFDWPKAVYRAMLAASPTPPAEQQAAPKAAPGELHDHQILAITTAYEQGVGKGRQAHKSGKEIANPYGPSYRCDLAWKYGYEEGKRQARQAAKAAPQPAPVVGRMSPSKEWLETRLAIADDSDVQAGVPSKNARPCDAPPGCNSHNCLECNDYPRAGGVQALSAAPAGFVPVAAFDRLHAHAESLAARLLAAEQAAPKAALGEPSAFPMTGDEEESDLGQWQPGTAKPNMDGTYLREFDEGEATSEFHEGQWLRDGFFPSDIQDARWRGRTAPQPSPTAQEAESRTAVARCTNSDTWNCKYCRKTETCDALQGRAAAPKAAPGKQFDSEGFRAWVRKNFPDDTIIGNSEWWADHLTTCAQRYAKAAPQQEAQEPVAWQSRTRPVWGDNTRPWSPWEPCTKAQAEDYWKAPLLHDWAYEARALYTAPQPAPAPLSEMPYEKRKAIQEGEQISASDAWFLARLNMLDTLDRRNVFRAGFDRGWNAAIAAQGGRDAG